MSSHNQNSNLPLQPLAEFVPYNGNLRAERRPSIDSDTAMSPGSEMPLPASMLNNPSASAASAITTTNTAAPATSSLSEPTIGSGTTQAKQETEAYQQHQRKKTASSGIKVHKHERTNTTDLSKLVLPKNSASFVQHRKGVFSCDSIPRQTIVKALASRAPASSQLSIAQAIHGMMGVSAEEQNRQVPQRKLSNAFSEFNLGPPVAPVAPKTPANVDYAQALASPCFFHKRFEDAVDIEKVMADLNEDDGFSHSRLMQTAISVREVSKQLQRRPIKRAVRNVMIVTKARDNSLVVLTRELTEWLITTPRYGSANGVNVYVDHKLRKSKRFDADGLVAMNPAYADQLRYWTPDLCWTSPEKFDLVLTLGGDGTVLFTSWLFQRIVPPNLSFSLGSLGFLTTFKYDQFKNSLNSIMGDAGMRVNLRMRFTCTVYRHPKNVSRRTSIAAGLGEGIKVDHLPNEHVEDEQYEVLNELVIDRGPSSYISQLSLYGDDNLLTVIQADGCIFSTPTGSTAYSLSAGGSLVHPDIPAILLSPICPHTLSFRPMLLNDTMLLRVEVPRNSRATAYCSFDGKGRVELKQGDYVTIAASQYPFPTVSSGEMEWFDSIARTLRWNNRGAMQKGWNEKEPKKGPNGEIIAAAEEEPEEEEMVEEEFDIDVDKDPEESATADSGYAGNGSDASTRTSPKRRAFV